MPKAHIECLDGLRGLAAMWVLVGHGLILTGWRLPLLGWPGLAVDLFMMLSGFLMAYHYRERREREPWSAPRTWGSFWLRRFFRIAPLYYVLLAAALLGGPALGAFRQEIAAVLPHTATAAARYTDQGWQNVAMHVSFLFGFSPDYGYRTALPDWSIGLEMSFYAVFPFLMLAVRRLGWVAAAIAAAALCTGLSTVFKDFFFAFAQPSLLALKLPIFLAGMLLAASLAGGGMVRLLTIGGSLLLCLWPVHGLHGGWEIQAVRLSSLAVLAGLLHHHRLPQVAGIRRAGGAVSTALGGRIASFFGDTSYGAYLLHLLVMIPAAALVIRWVAPADPATRFGLTMLIVVPIVYGVAWLLHIGIERPGIRLGRWIIALTRTPTQKQAAI